MQALFEEFRLCDLLLPSPTTPGIGPCHSQPVRQKAPFGCSTTVRLQPGEVRGPPREVRGHQLPVASGGGEQRSRSKDKGDSYIAVTLHGIDSQWVLHSFLLDIVPTGKSQKSRHLSPLVHEVLETWALSKDDLIAVTTDSGGNMVNLVKHRLGVTWVYCMAHSINLSVDEGLKQEGAASLLAKVKRICNFFRRSTKAANFLAEVQERLGLQVLKMKVHIKIRWNSAYAMMQRLLVSRGAVSLTLTTVTGTRKKPPPDLLPDEWTLLEAVVALLDPFSKATTCISQQRHPTISFVMPLFRTLCQEHLTADPSDLPAVAAMKEAIRSDMAARWRAYTTEIPDLVILSVYFDPRFKKFTFISDPVARGVILSRACSLARSLLSQGPPSAPSNVRDNSTNVTAGSTPTPLRSHYLTLFGNSITCPPQEEDSLETEISHYHARAECAFFSNPILGTVTDPCLWWKEHQIRYPRLARFARRYLCISATSVPSESTFSKSGWIVNKRRTLLSHKNVSNLTFLSANLPHIE